MWLYCASTKTPLGFSSASPLPKYEEQDLEGDPSRSTHRPPDKAFKIQECHCFGASDHRSSFSYIIILHLNICLISYLISSKCAVLKSLKTSGSYSRFSYLLILLRSGKLWKKLRKTASSGERVCFTSTRRFEVFADQPSPRLDHDSTPASEKSTSRAKANSSYRIRS